jgi:hypothetical protein
LGVISVLAGLAVGFLLVKRLFGREVDQPADVATFDFYVEAGSVENTGLANSVREQHIQ